MKTILIALCSCFLSLHVFGQSLGWIYFAEVLNISNEARVHIYTEWMYGDQSTHVQLFSFSSYQQHDTLYLNVVYHCPPSLVQGTTASGDTVNLGLVSPSINKITILPISILYSLDTSQYDTMPMDRVTIPMHPTGIVTTSHSSVNLLYNNPVFDKLSITVSEQNRFPAALSIFDQYGRRITAMPDFVIRSASSQINLSSLPPGFYIGQIAFEDGKREQFKFLKE